MKLPFEQVESRVREFGERRYYYSRIVSAETIRIAAAPVENPFDFSGKGGKWRSFHVGDAWPKIDAYYWLQIPMQIPDDAPGGPYDLIVQLSKDYSLHTPEGLVFINGNARHGVDRMHHTVRLCDAPKRLKKVDAAVRVYTGASLVDFRPAVVRPAHLEECSLASLDENARDFYFLTKSVHDALATMPDDSWVKGQLLNLLVEAFNRVDYCYPRSDEFYASVKTALRFVKTEMKNIPAQPLPETVTGVGHAHIDVAWLWPLKRTREKAIHTFSTAVDLMARYPEHRFFQSQAQLYEYVKQDQPVLFKKIKERIKNGQWEADGGMWVEADCNLTSGESLVRQLLYGRRFFEEELGVRPKVVWLPDVFGYSWALPQILKLAEVDYFVTSKISWNQYNQMPFDTFRWRGVDGSEVMTYFITVPCHYWFYTYNGLMEPKEIKGTWDNFKPKSLHDEVLLTYGYGDGGGGPTEEMLLTARSLKDVPGFPTTRTGRVDDFLRRLNKIRDKAPVWSGELYLEYHRGTYTSQAQQKKRNRALEFLLQKTEFAASVAALQGYAYPRERLRKAWERVLLNQFHDIIPGSSIREVYEESARDYDWVDAEARTTIDGASKKLVKRGDKDAFTAINTLSLTRSEPFVLEGLETKNALLDSNGDAIETQAILTIDGETKILANWPLAPFSANTLREADAKVESNDALRVGARTLENETLKIKFNANGELTSVYDKEAKREVLEKGQAANVFQVFEDKPLMFEAWDIELYYQDKMLSTGGKAEYEIVQNGPLCATLKIQKEILDGCIEQYVSIYRGSRRIDFDTRIEWSNKDTLLKVAFPVAIHAASATYDIQFGNVERPTHWNTSWDWARFETCAQKWIDLSEGDYGVGLLNDCKYGHDVHDNVMRLTLIKCASAPDPLADVGEHRFAYSLYPHPGDWRDARLPQKAYEFNTTPLMLNGAWNHASLPEATPFVSVDCDNVIVETVKMAEKEDAYIVRLFECYNQRGPLTLTFHQPVQSASECNLLERNDAKVTVKGNAILLQMKPFEIKTVKVKF